MQSASVLLSPIFSTKHHCGQAICF